MSDTIAKGRLFRVSVEVNEERLEQMKRAPAVTQAALQAGADFWHDKVLPKHFEPGAGAQYGYARRALTYIKQQHGKPALVHSGSLRRDLKAKAAFTMGAGYMELRMSARVLNFAPTMPENSDDMYVNRKKGRGYPNLKREIKAITAQETEAIAAVVNRRLEIAFGDTEGRESDD